MTGKYKSRILSLLAATAFDPGKAGWKTDDAGNIEIRDGNPVYLDSSGREVVIQPDTISRLNGEAKSHREAKERLEQQLQAFKDLDPEKARDAITKLAEIDQSKLIDSGKLDELKSQITSQFQAQLAEKDKAISDGDTRYNNLLISNLFANSEFVRNNVAVPVDMLEATFRNSFKVEDNKIVAYGRDGQRVQHNFMDADPETALKILVESHPHKDMILKANTGNGSGSDGKGGQRSGSGRIMKRDDFAKLDGTEQAAYAAKARAGEIQIVD